MALFCSGTGTSVYGVEKFIVEIEVPRISYFAINKNFAAIKKGMNTLGRIAFRNNTQDGFRVSVMSENGGQLFPEETNDGEYSIPYTLTLGFFSIEAIDKFLNN